MFIIMNEVRDNDYHKIQKEEEKAEKESVII